MDVDKIDTMFIENLEEWILEEDKVVTYKLLSRALKCHVNVAKQMLFNFVTEQKEKRNSELGIVYLVSGNVKSLGEDSKLKVVLVEERNLEEEIKKFEKVLSRHIYSVQKSKNVTSTSLFGTDHVGLKGDVYSCNTQSAIKNKSAVPKLNLDINRQNQQLNERNVKSEVKEVEPEIKKEIKEEIKSESKTKKISSIESAFSKSKPKKSPEQADGRKLKKPTSNISSMFAKQSANAKPKVKEELSSSTSPGKENLENAQIEGEKEETNEEKEKTATKNSASTNKKPSSTRKKSVKDDMKKRKRIRVASDSESEDSEEDQHGEKDIVGDMEEAPLQASIIDSDEEEIPSTPIPEPSQSTGRRKVKKEVEKTFLDESGFMVTKREVVFVSEDEAVVEEAPKPTKKESKAFAEPVAKKTKLSSGNNKQPSIMSFFKKK